MKLWIMRHGYAGTPKKDPKQERERPLLPEGRKMVQAIAKAMWDADEVPKYVFSSPFQRTTETGDILAKYFGLQNQFIGDLAPMRPLEPGIKNLVSWEEMKRVLIVGHVDNTSPAMNELGSDWDDLVMAEVRRVEIDRDTLEWTLEWGLKPSDLGLKDHS